MAGQLMKSAGFFFVLSLTLGAQTALNDRVLVVYNAHVPDSKQVAEYYLQKRAIPESHLCRIDTSSSDQINRGEYDSRVKQPIQKCLNQVGKDTILYIVFSHQTPFLLDLGSQTNALDSFVADIWDEVIPERTATQAEVQPYFGLAQSEGDVYQPYVSLADYRKRPNAKTIYSVWRLDAPSVALAKGLVDKALYAEANGLSGGGCFDRNRGNLTGVMDYGYGSGDWEIHRAADFARQAGFTVTEDDHEQEFGTAPAPARCDHAALYAGWYALNHYNDAFSWNPGAIGLHLDSASATSAKGGPSWAANALAHGITVTAGATTEPYLENLPHPDQAFFCLFRGANVGDALLRSERMIKWNIMNIGDPLYRPFPNMGSRVTPPIIFALGPKLTLGNMTSNGIIAVSKLAENNLTFTLSSDNPGVVTVPSNVTIPAGSDAYRFPIMTHKVASEPTTVRLRAKSDGYEISNTLVVFSLLGGVSVNPERMKGGSRAAAAVLLRHTASATTTFALKSGNPAVVKVPAEVTAAQGQNKVTFDVETKPVIAQTPVQISVEYEGLAQSVTVTVVP